MAQYKRLKKTLSAWTPIHNASLCDSLYEERKRLIFHWFNMWTHRQRVNFLECVVFDVCSSDLVKLLHSWTCKAVPKEKLDFTTVLPRYLSLKIFSYLDPKSLCNASQVNWCWKIIADHDSLWMPKCTQHQWYLPYSAGDKEYGGWKQHFVTMVHTLDIYLPKLKITQALAKVTKSDVQINTEKRSSLLKKKTMSLKPTMSAMSSFLQPRWMVTSAKPKDLEDGWKRICNNTDIPLSTQNFKSQKRLSDISGLVSTEVTFELAKNLDVLEWRQAGKRHERSYTDPTTVRTLRSMVMTKPPDHNITALTKDRGINTLSDATRLSKETNKLCVDSKDINLPSSVLNEVKCSSKLPEQQSKMVIPERLNLLLMGYPNMSHPRVMIISSAIPAYEVLQHAIIPGVLQLTYNSKSFTTESILSKLDHLLCGRLARSIGLFVEEKQGGLKFSADFHLSASSHKADKRVGSFLRSLSSRLIPAKHYGHVDLFVPLTTSETGLETLSIIQDELSLPSSVPLVSCFNNYSDYVKSEWINCPETMPPPMMYFDEIKYCAWSYNNDLAEEAVNCVEQLCLKCFDQLKHDCIEKYLGKIIFEAVGLQKFSNVKRVFSVLVNSIKSYTNQEDEDDPLLFICKYLLNYAHGASSDKETTKITQMMTGDMATGDHQEIHKLKYTKQEFYPASTLQESVTILGMSDRRTIIVKKVLNTEQSYKNLLNVIQTIFAAPLRLAILNNSPIISSTDHNLIFADAEILLHINRNFVQQLTDRLKHWTVEQVLSNLFEKNIIQKLHLFWNYIHNYPVMIATINKCLQHNPSFGAYLHRYDCKPATNMMSLIALLKCPIQQVQKYIELLQALILFTPTDHADKVKLQKFVEQLDQLNNEVKEQDDRAMNVRELYTIQQNIINCPMLIEGNRRLLIDVSVQEMKLVIPENWIFGSCGELHLFLFSDSLVITRKTRRMIPYLLSHLTKTEFELAIGLDVLTVKELDNSTGLKNYFVLIYKNKQWICQLEPATAKMEFLEMLSQAKCTNNAGISQ